MSLSQSLEVEEELEELRQRLKEIERLFDRYIAAIESVRRQYNDSTCWYYDGIESGLNEILQEYYNLKGGDNNDL